MPIDLDKPLLNYGEEPWTVRDSFEGTQIFGAPGSGKTSGSGKAIALRMLSEGFGGLVLCAKPGEAEEWQGYAEATGRPSPVIVRPGGGFRFNILEFEQRQDLSGSPGEPPTLDLVSLFLNALSSGDQAVSRNEPYWDEALRELLIHTIDLCRLAVGKLTLPDMDRVIRTAPQSMSELGSASWKRGQCYELLALANEKRHALSLERFVDLDQTFAYWLQDFPRLSDRVRSIVVSSFTAKVSGLFRSPLRDLFCADGDRGGVSEDIVPKQCRRGSVIVLDLPVKQWGEVGRFGQVLYKTVWQRYMERNKPDWRDANPLDTAAFLWADEAQYFVTKDDARFQQTARSSGIATVNLTQNIPNYIASLGGESSRPAIESLLGNLRTKIFHYNNDPTTNEWAERLFGRVPDFKEEYASQQSSGFTHRHERPVMPAQRFTMLLRGGPPYGLTQAVVYLGRMRSAHGSDREASFVEACFDQVPGGKGEGPNKARQPYNPKTSRLTREFDAYERIEAPPEGFF